MLFILFFVPLCTSIDFSSGALNGYFNLNEITSILTDYSKTHPNLELTTIGNTFNNISIPAVRLSNSHRARILIVGGHHARELISMTQVLYILDHILESKKHTHEIWFVPVLNVEGLAAMSEEFGKSGQILEIRKNLHPSDCPELQRGVDLNRNYGFMWGIDSSGSSASPCAEEYRGESAFSEKETQAIKTLIEKYQFDSVISYHSYGDMYIRPTGYHKTELVEFPKAHQELYLGLKDILPMSFRFGTVQDLLGYNANGALMDYLFSLKIFAIEIEIGPESYNSFHPGIEKLTSILESHLEPFELILNQTSGFLVVKGSNFGRNVVFEVFNEGLAMEYSKDLVVEVVNKSFEYRMISLHQSRTVNGAVYVTLPNILSGQKEVVEMLIFTEEHDLTVSAKFWPEGNRELSFVGDMRMKASHRETYAMVVIGVVAGASVFVLGIGIWLCYRYRNGDKLEFMEMVEVIPNVGI